MRSGLIQGVKMGSKERPSRQTAKRYGWSAAQLRQWPHRWLLFGERMMPVAIHLQALANTHRTVQRREGEQRGRAHNLAEKVRHLENDADKTRKYIQEMKARLDQAADDGLTVATFLQQDRT